MSHIIINVVMESKIGDKVFSKGKAIVKAGVSLTTYNNPQMTEKTFKAMQNDGKDCALKDDIIVERFDGKTAHQIADKIEKDIQQLSEKFHKIMRVKFSRVYVK